MSVKNTTQFSKAVAEFVAKMNAIGLTPYIHTTEDDVTIAFSLEEFMAAMKKTIMTAGVREDKITIEIVPFKGTEYIKIYMRK